MSLIVLNSDLADEWTDLKEEEIEKNLDTIYREAYLSMQKKINKFGETFDKNCESKEKLVSEGKWTEDQYKTWKINRINELKSWETLKDQYAKKITEANQIASDYINSKTPEIYAFNHNFDGYLIEKNTGINYGIVNKNTVKFVATGNNATQFKVKGENGAYTYVKRLSVNSKKSYNWNSKKIQNTLMSGIVSGKSVKDIAKDFYQIMGSNKKASIRNARTAVTSAQNGGRYVDRLEASKRFKDEYGITLYHQWSASHDARTRDSHASIDGEIVAVGEKFGNGLLYPSDPNGIPSEVYNCRCSTKTVFEYGEEDNKLLEQAKELDRQELKALEKQSDTGDKVRSTAFNSLVNGADTYKDIGIIKVAVSKREKKLSNEEIIKEIAGADRTSGSCVSVAMSYIAQKAGLDVHDFRGGFSMEYFSRKINNRKFVNLNGVKGNVVVVNSRLKEVTDYINENTAVGKEYMLNAGVHCSIIRRTEGGFDFLEMQSNLENGWLKVNDWEEKLNRRFGYKKVKKSGSNFMLLDVDSLVNSEEFLDLMPYINTVKNEMKIGVGGYAK